MAIDKVRPLKLEDPASGGTETDEFPTSLDPSEDHIQVAGVVFEDATHNDENVRIWRDGADLKLQDESTSVKTLTELASGTGMTEGQHEVLDTLVHEIDETSFDEVTYSGSNVSSYIVWTSAAKTQKVREETYTYSSGKVLQSVTKQYDGTGTLKMTMTEDYTYSGSRVTSVTRTKS